MHHKLNTGSPVAVPDAPVLSIDQIEDRAKVTLLTTQAAHSSEGHTRDSEVRSQ